MKKPTPTNNNITVHSDDFLVSKTDLKGKITYCNPAFMKTVGYTEQELLGQPHNIIRHPDMPKVIFKHLWDTIIKKEEVFAYVKNLTKDGSYYWVFANVTASLDDKGTILGYYSVRRKVGDKALDLIKPLYEKLLSLEKNGGVNASYKYLTDLLKEKGVSYDEFINNLQRA